MSDAQPSLLLHAESSDAVAAAQVTPASGPTAGQMLKQARLRAGLTLEELSGRVKVTVARLQALEDDRSEAWPNIAVMRAAASSVCRHVQIEPGVVLDRLPQAEKIQLGVAGPEAKVGFRDRGGFTLRQGPGVGRMPLLLIAVAVVVLAALVYVAPNLIAWADHIFARELPVAAPSVAGSVTEPLLPPDAGPTDTRVGAVTPEPSAAASAPSAVPVASAASVAVKSVASTASVAADAAPAQPLVVIKAKGLTWITVSDAKGVTLLRKTLSAGQVASASGALPLWVVVGRADNAEVTVRGQTVSLEPSVPDNVAKFKVQ